MAHFKVAHENIHVQFAVGILIDLAFRAIQEVELPVRYISHFLEERLELFAITLCHNKIQIAVFTSKKLLEIPTFHTDRQSTDGAQAKRVFTRGINQPVHFSEDVR